MQSAIKRSLQCSFYIALFVMLLVPLRLFAAAPLVSTFSPADDATGVAIITDTLIITFDQVVQGSGGTVVLKKASDDSTVETIVASGSQVSGSGTDTITITLSSSLGEYNVGYYVQIDANAFLNESAEYYAGIAGNTTWNFTTEAETTPYVGGSSSSTLRRDILFLLGFVEYLSLDTSTQQQIVSEVEEQEEQEELLEEEEEQEAIVEQLQKPLVVPRRTMESRFKQRVCARVLSRFRRNKPAFMRANERLERRFGFSCSPQRPQRIR